MQFLGLFLVFLLVVVGVPWVFIWAINAIFALSIAFTFKTWLASLVLILIIQGSHTSKD
jgi:hypothetical protein